MNFSYLLDPEHWDPDATGGFPQLLLAHLGYSALALLIGLVIALPVGLYIGHTGRGSFIAINAGNAGRALPTLGLLMLMVTLLGLGLLPVLIALTVLVVPPILTTTYAGMRALDHGVVDAAKGMGMRPWQVLTRVEFPMALPVIMSGIRSALLQVVATATVAAAVGLGGLGRLLIDGLSVNDYSRVLAGAIVVAVLAVALDLLLALTQRWIVSPGLSGRAVARTRRATTT
ncbi:MULTISPECIES: ABC transporter permease subunit [Actinoplanes]|uniref:ABC transporter permease n=1 Tax=Actinoplanes TaxID=1865 RepID=UPI0005F2EA5D|nr:MULTISPECIES: ABC transporter permease subunit [Actinoplanes]GLY08424.1 glycine/betaine ABC transporter permease [Actinoplanes sp. NBRC 101535]